MKKILVTTAAAYLLTLTVSAQSEDLAIKKNISGLHQQESLIKKEKKEDKKELKTLKGKEVSSLARDQFYRDFGTVSGAVWTREDNFDKVTYMKNGITSTSFYDADAALIGTTTNKTFDDLPANAQKHITAKYPGYTTESVIFFDDNEYNQTDMWMYNQRFEDADNYFAELKKDNKIVVVKINMSGEVSFFKQI